MTARRFRWNTLFRSARRVTLALALIMGGVAGTADAQTNEDRSGFAIRELSLGSGYTFLQLPPITLGGNLPTDVLDQDLITSAAATMQWRRVTDRTRYTLDMFGAFTARTHYSQLNAPNTNLAFTTTRALGTRWQLEAGVANVIASSDQIAGQPTQARQLIDASPSFNDLAATAARITSASPDPEHAALFMPITQALAASDVYGNRSMASSARGAITYRHSMRLATVLRGGYTGTRSIGRPHELRLVPASLDSTAISGSVAVQYDRSERTQVTTSVEWAQTSGVFTDKLVIAAVGYSWTGRKWFSSAAIGAGVPIQVSTSESPEGALGLRRPEVVYRGAIGYKFGSQTLLASYQRAAHDEYGHGGRNTLTGFQGNVQSAVAAWSWTPHAPWFARADFTAVRRPGNFSYIYAWLSTFGIGRRLTPTVGLMGELLFDRHGSRAFEGFHVLREGARVSLIWTPRRRSVE